MPGLLDEGRFRALAAAHPSLGLVPLEPLSGHCSLRVGGPAALFAEAGDRDRLVALLGLARAEGLRVQVLGGGTNLLFSDLGFEGLVLRLSGDAFAGVRVAGPGDGAGPGAAGPEGAGDPGLIHLAAGAGAPLGRLLGLAADQGLTGLEDLAGIPGTVGGAIRMNAGARGQTAGGALRWLVALDLADPLGPRERVLGRGSLSFAYRGMSTPLSEPLFLEGRFALRPDPDPGAPARRMAGRLRERAGAIPAGPSAGSFFKNPEGDHAGRLIEACGLKGRRVGGAMVSRGHANVLVNAGGAKASDFLALSQEIADRVRAAFGISLEREVRVVGFAGEPGPGDAPGGRDERDPGRDAPGPGLGRQGGRAL